MHLLGFLSYPEELEQVNSVDAWMKQTQAMCQPTHPTHILQFDIFPTQQKEGFHTSINNPYSLRYFRDQRIEPLS